MTDDEFEQWAHKIYSACEFMEWPYLSDEYPDRADLLAMKDFVAEYEARR